MLPTTIAGFSTVSSATAMPLIILGGEEIANDLTSVVVPTVVNIHFIGRYFTFPYLPSLF